MRASSLAILAAGAVTVLASAALFHPAPGAAAAADVNKMKRGLEISPVVPDLRGKSRLMVGLGSYIVNGQGGCVGCHTSPTYKPGGDPFRGEPEAVNTDRYLAGGAKFGPFTSRNLTPDATGKPAGLTLAQFLKVMRTGRDLKEQHMGISPLLQVMPWPDYAKMTDGDLRAVYEYLTSIPHADPAP